MWNFGNLARGHHYPRHHFMGYGRSNYAEGISTEKKNLMMDAAIYKGAAVITAGLTGGISAYKGLPEIKNFAGADVLLGLALSGVEFYMLYKGGSSSKVVATVGGVSTGLLCHWAAVQGTIWGATKARAEGLPGPSIGVAGWDDRNYGDTAPQAALPPSGRVPVASARAPQFDTNYGMM